jgi:molecular chaperone HtpG
MSDDDKKDLETLFKSVLPEGNDYSVEADNLGEGGAPVLITQNEFMRRYREMSSLGGGMYFYGEMPRSYNITVNLENPVVASIVKGMKDNKEKVKEYAEGNDRLRQVVDLALLSNGMLKGKALSDFIARSARLLSAE